MKSNWIYKAIWTILIFVVFISCEELPCEDSDGVQVNVGFYKLDGVTLTDSIIDTLTLQLYNEVDTPYTEDYFKKQAISFPLSQLADTSTIIFMYKDSVYDTLIFRYDKTLILENHKCGFANFFDITSITTSNNRLDSVWIRKNLVEYGDEENVKIYF